MPAPANWFDTVQTAFPDHDLCNRILVEARIEPARLPKNEEPRLPALFEDLARHVIATKRTHEHTGDTAPANAKKRKLDDGAAGQHTNGTASQEIAQAKAIFTCKDVSFQVPARKKMKLQLVEDGADKQKREVRLLNPTTEKVEYALPGAAIDQVFCLPTPESIKRQTSFLLFPAVGATMADGSPAEQIVFTMHETTPQGIETSEQAPADDDTYVTVTERALGTFLSPFGKAVTLPSVAEFSSSIPQAHRKGEKAYHVKAHRGSKEGYLFFLPNGIVFGFKKPLAFFAFGAVEAISYTSVLQRTFNLVISAVENPAAADAQGEEPEAKDVEFSMLDQADFAGIDDYVKRHGLSDASMAAQRRAKLYGVNKDKTKGAEVNGGDSAAGDEGADGDGETELQKAERQLQDAEDDEEDDEDFADESESDGGSASSDSEGEEGEEGADGELDVEEEEDGGRGR